MAWRQHTPGGRAIKADWKNRVLASLAAVLLLSCLIWGAAPAAEAAAPKVTAAVTRVVDGDTFYARLSGGREEKVRLIGVDAPESTVKIDPSGKQAAAYTQVMTIPPNVKYADLFVKFQREAREKGKGLWGAAAGSGAVKRQDTAAKAAYIGNSRTKVFHLPYCRWAGEISPANRAAFRSRAEAVNGGYRPCKVCRP